MPTVVLVAQTEPGWATALQDWSSSQGWQLAHAQDSQAVTTMLGSGADVRAIVGAGEALGEEALTFSQDRIAVVYVGNAGAEPGRWVSTVGEPGARHDQAAFLAGVMTGLASQSLWVGEVTDTGGPREAVYRAGFHQGLRYGCPKCQLVSFSAAEATLDGYRGKGVDVVFPLPGPAASDAAQLLADGGLTLVWVGEHDPALVALAGEAVAGRVIGAPDVLVIPALKALLASGEGQSWPYSIESRSLILFDISDTSISPGRQRLLVEAYDAIAEGELNIGLDPETGQPR